MSHEQEFIVVTEKMRAITENQNEQQQHSSKLCLAVLGLFDQISWLEGQLIGHH